MNELETQLRSWAPRPPSARISRALFGAEAVAGPSLPASPVTRHSSPTFRLTWLAPAAAAFALMCAFFFHQPNNATPSGNAGVSPIMAVILSNQSAGSVILEASNREPFSPAANHRSFELNASGSVPKAFGVATSGVSTGASERLPGWGSKPPRPAEGPGDYPATNGARITPQAGAFIDTGALRTAAVPAASSRGVLAPCSFESHAMALSKYDPNPWAYQELTASTPHIGRSADIPVRSDIRTGTSPNKYLASLPPNHCCGQECPRSGGSIPMLSA